MPWRPDLLPLRQRCDLLMDVPLPIGPPAIALAALPARLPREDAPGCRCLRKRPAFAGAGWAEVSCATAPVCHIPVAAARTARSPDLAPASGGEDGKKTIFLRTMPERAS